MISTSTQKNREKYPKTYLYAQLLLRRRISYYQPRTWKMV